MIDVISGWNKLHYNEVIWNTYSNSGSLFQNANKNFIQRPPNHTDTISGLQVNSRKRCMIDDTQYTFCKYLNSLGFTYR